MIYCYLSDILVWNDVHNHDSSDHDRYSMNYYGGDNKVYSDDDKLRLEHGNHNMLMVYSCCIQNDSHGRNYRP